MRFTLFVLLTASIFLLFSFCTNSSDNKQKKSGAAVVVAEEHTFGSVRDSLLKRGIDTAFINKYMNSNKLEFSQRYVKINVTGYLKPTDYSFNYNARSVAEAKVFLSKNMEILKLAEAKYGVPKEVIVSILWVETKCGTILGKNHLPSVFFSTALVNEEKYRQVNYAVLDTLQDNDVNKDSLKEKITKRSEKKAKWALGELEAMAKIEQKYSIDWDSVYGSWAGAFGICQFLPSSYLGYAVDGNNDGRVDLFNIDDAINSVGNYLSKHKWGNTVEKQRKAVYSYNNSKAYVDCVLKLAELIED